MRELPRQLSREELEELFSGPSTLVSLLAETEDPLGRAEEIANGLPDEDKVEALATHPRIGEPSPEQHGDDPTVLTELAYLNQVYEEKFGFRFVVFVAGRPHRDILPVLRERLAKTREEELETGITGLVAIAQDRWQDQWRHR
ncbi:MAG TPA: 2-oxo-4-hydroxy-4-carboxy-5-ureidoimidazoline decarboxylase [Gaiellaceae bacterium]|nr:2-oxo-4-hydroxy-4-carboxy-5-ureidoimidazoline decarboxylase [Gaiellaceae bacterium]